MICHAAKAQPMQTHVTDKCLSCMCTACIDANDYPHDRITLDLIKILAESAQTSVRYMLFTLFSLDPFYLGEIVS